jgi:hypothetical protein
MKVGDLNDDWSVLNGYITPGGRYHKEIEQLADSQAGSRAPSVFDETESDELRDEWMKAAW